MKIWLPLFEAPCASAVCDMQRHRVGGQDRTGRCARRFLISCHHECVAHTATGTWRLPLPPNRTLKFLSMWHIALTSLPTRTVTDPLDNVVPTRTTRFYHYKILDFEKNRYISIYNSLQPDKKHESFRASSSETSGHFYQTTRRQIPYNRRQNPKCQSYFAQSPQLHVM
jgi:hypothetical protein